MQRNICLFRCKQAERLSRDDAAAIRILSDQHLQSGPFPYQGHMRAVEGGLGGEGRDGGWGA